MNIATYIKNSVSIIKTHTIVFLIVAIVSGINTLSFLLGHFQQNNLLDIPVMVITFTATLVIYGLYYEIIEDRYTSLREIFSKYIYGYFIISLITVSPIVLFAFILSLATSGDIYQLGIKLINILISVAFMYVIPYFFHTNRVVESFRCGLGFLAKNFQKSLPLIVAVVLLYSAKFILGYKLISLVSINVYVFAFAQYVFMFSYLILDYALFIVLVLAITRNK